MKALKFIMLLLLIIANTTSSQNSNVVCSFKFLHHFGDGITDIGNSVKIPPLGPFLPPNYYPYGITFPGRPTGRWSDGLVDTDYAGKGLGLPLIESYLSLDYASTSYDGVAYSVARSTVLDTSFFHSKNIHIPSYVTPLSTQFSWFKKYLHLSCQNQTECAKRRPKNSIVLFEFSEVNDIAYALVQGKSFAEVTSYIPLIVQAQVNAAREAIKLGKSRLVYTIAVPLGCYLYILTELYSKNRASYDELGCLRSVNNLIVSYNSVLRAAFNVLSVQFPKVTILPGDFYTATRTIINQTSVLGPKGNVALKSCCGIGGKYNYNKKRFCGSSKVPVCPNPKRYVFWDGIHFTQDAIRRILNILVPPALPFLNCTST